MTLEIITRTPPQGTATRPTPLLCVHGILHGAWAYDEYFLPHLAQRGYVASAVSLRGHGGSPLQGSLRWVTIGQYVQDVATVAAQLKEQYGTRPVIIGHSMGGLITQKYLEQHQAPAGVLLTSVPTHGAVLATLRALRKDPLRLMALVATFDFRRYFAHAPNARWAMFSPDMPEEEFQRHFERMGNESFTAFLGMLLFSLPRPSRVKTPLLVLGAESDAFFSPGEIIRTAKAYNAEYRIFPGLAHDVMLEANWQQVADYMVDWLQARGL